MANPVAKASTPTSATGCPDLRRQGLLRVVTAPAAFPPASERLRAAAGFTLIEILIVMSLLLIVAGLAVVRLDDGGERATRRQAEELTMRLEAARDEAVYGGQPIAFSTDGENYQFWAGDTARQQWFAAGSSGELGPRRLGAEVRIVAQAVSGRDRPLGERIVFTPDGVSEPFLLRLKGGRSLVEVEGDALGRVGIREAQSDEK